MEAGVGQSHIRQNRRKQGDKGVTQYYQECLVRDITIINIYKFHFSLSCIENGNLIYVYLEELVNTQNKHDRSDEYIRVLTI